MMNNKEDRLNIYLMGIGGTGMGAFAGLLHQSGHQVFGSDNAIYSPMKEQLTDWGISYKTPYSAQNIPSDCDLVIIGNVIRRENPESVEVLQRELAYDSFPSALYKLFLKNAIPIVASGTHGKTTCSALLAHTLFAAGHDPGFLIGGIPLNFQESFRASGKPNRPFVVEGDEYDTAFFDKRPKFIHYAPRYLLVTSLEFDHGDIYRDVDAIIEAFSSLMKTMKQEEVVVLNSDEPNIFEAIKRSDLKSTIITYGAQGDYRATEALLDEKGIKFVVEFRGRRLGEIAIPLYGEHNLKNALGCYAVAHQYGLSHQEINAGFNSFKGVKRRLSERFNNGSIIALDDFAHHPTAVLETIKAVRQKYPHKKVYALFEPRSATSCMKVFQKSYAEALATADRVLIAPPGRVLNKENCIDIKQLCQDLNTNLVPASSYETYQELKQNLATIKESAVLLFMSNGDFGGVLNDLSTILE